ncbi:Eco57I restriction-modification methylase domain-containing protein [Clostridium estertheticum]
MLKNTIYGIDINATSVEITKLSLWLKTNGNISNHNCYFIVWSFAG